MSKLHCTRGGGGGGGPHLKKGTTCTTRLVGWFGGSAKKVPKSRLLYDNIFKYKLTEFTAVFVHHSQGSTFRSRILAAMRNNTFFNNRMLPYNQTTEGSSLYSAYLDTASKMYPQYMNELRGLADGAQMQFSEVAIHVIVIQQILISTRF